MFSNERLIDTVIPNQQMGDAVKQRQITFWSDGVMLCSRHRCLRAARIHDNDLRVALILQHPLPHDRMRNAGIGADENEHITLLKILISERWRIKAKAFFVSCHSRSHTLACITVAMNHSHAKFSQGTQIGHLLKHDLPGAQKSGRFRTMLGLNLAHFVAKKTQCSIPIHWLTMQQWHRGPI